MTTHDQSQYRLNRLERSATLLAAAAMLYIALALVLSPLPRQKEERDIKGQTTKLTIEPADNKEVSMLLTASSLVLFFWGINGLRLSKLTVGSVSAEVKAPEVEAAEKFSEKESTPKEVTLPSAVPATADDPPTKESGIVKTQEGPEAVYSLTSVPSAVLEDLFKNWPTEFAQQKPTDYSTFEFASKKSGKGNHPWTVKFSDLPAFKVAYGGQGKETPTVAQL